MLGIKPPLSKPLTLHGKLKMMHGEMTSELDANHKSNIFLFENLRGLATHLALFYPFPSLEAIVSAIKLSDHAGDQAAQGQRVVR